MVRFSFHPRHMAATERSYKLPAYKRLDSKLAACGYDKTRPPRMVS